MEHLLTAPVWIALRGESFASDLSNLTQSQLDDPAAVWPVYVHNQGGKLPWIFFGIKSYRLYAWSQDRSTAWLKLRSATLRAIRFCWRWFNYVTGMSALILTTAYAPITLNRYDRAVILTTAFLLVLGCIAIAAEGYLFFDQLKGWAYAYHHSLSLTPRLSMRDLGKQAFGLAAIV